jgi:hypothetical protein
MSVLLTDSQGESLKVNAWNWGVLHFTVTCSKVPLFEEETVDALRYGGIDLSENHVKVLHNFLKQVVLPLLKPGERLLDDLSVTSELDDGTFHRDDLSKNYSLHYEVLVQIIEFLADSKAPIKVS